MDERKILHSQEFAEHPDTHEKEPNLSVIQCTPFLTPEQFFALSEGMEAIVVITFATGTVPDRIVPAIKRRIEEGIAVVALTNNPGNDHGMLRITYDAGSEAYESGMVGLQKVNVNHVQEVLKALSTGIKEGLRGADLANAMQEKYAYREEEEKPRAEWEQ